MITRYSGLWGTFDVMEIDEKQRNAQEKLDRNVPNL